MKFNHQKGFIVPLIGGIVALLIAGGIYWTWHSKGQINSNVQNNVTASSTTSPIVGNDRDTHGCIGSAGYSWNETEQKCARPWQEASSMTSNSSSSELTSTKSKPSTNTHMSNTSNTNTKFTPDFTTMGQQTIIYKTSDDFYSLVPVTLNSDKTAVIAYPDIRDVYYSGYASTQLAYPTRLDNGYLLDNRGITKDSAFTKYTYEQYTNLSSTPSSSQLYMDIVNTSPFTEMYYCGYRNFKHDTEQDTVNQINLLIVDSGGLTNCNKII